MRVEIDIEGELPDGRVFLTWAPVKATARVIDGGAGGDVDVLLENGGSAGGGKVVFDTKRRHDGDPSLRLRLPRNGTPVAFWVAGEFGEPSKSYGDAGIKASVGGAVVGTTPLMVRIRKDAQTLTEAERDRFLVALARLNDAGAGPFRAFRDMHTNLSSREAHGGPGFLSWHRSYLLDLERELQAIDPSVALPYWRFDKPAPNIFDSHFLSMPAASPTAGDLVRFPPGHPLEHWSTDSFTGVMRRPNFDISTAPPSRRAGRAYVLTERETLDLGVTFRQLRAMESAPHGPAHVSFSGFISSIPTAAKDPLFFLLHGNVDRLWAKWQWANRRFDTADPDAFQAGGPLGHRLPDTMWPWNGVTGGERPPTAPGGPLKDSPVTRQPGPKPTVGVMLDYLGVRSGLDQGFAYDDVPFEAA